MSFRNRLTSFFLLIVLVPMAGVGVTVFRLISDSGHSQAEARAAGVAAAAASLYGTDVLSSRGDAYQLARRAPALPRHGLTARLKSVMAQAGLQRLVISRNGRTLYDIGSRAAIAPSKVVLRQGRTVWQVAASTTLASTFAASLAAPGSNNGVVVRQGGRTLAATPALAGQLRLPSQGTVTIGGHRYEAFGSRRFTGFGARPVTVTVLSNVDAGTTSLGSTRLLAAVFIVGFLLLAVSFAFLASRGLESQLSRFLRAARRLAGGDFSAPVPVEGSDDFAMLAVEFNNMSQQLAQRLDELNSERARLRESIRRAGETFASNLDRQALLSLALRTAVDGVEGAFGRVSARSEPDGPLWEVVRERSPDGSADVLLAAERQALHRRVLAECSDGDTHVAAVPLGPWSPLGRPFGLVTIGRHGRPFTVDDKDLLRSLGAQTTLALENVELHQEVARRAVTDELTGLANHGRFQEVLGSEMEQVRRYHYPVGLIMLDLDNFKKINDTYGHPQGDLVLKQVARVLQGNSREADSPARYGGEEMALILPHTDLEGAYAIAERVRTAIAALHIPLIDGGGELRVTASIGVGATSEGHKEALIGATDAALYRAKHEGKNRTVRAAAPAANVAGGE
jgi:diguanylate cyclase (GGDEF)-like protein